MSYREFPSGCCISNSCAGRLPGRLLHGGASVRVACSVTVGAGFMFVGEGVNALPVVVGAGVAVWELERKTVCDLLGRAGNSYTCTSSALPLERGNLSNLPSLASGSTWGDFSAVLDHHPAGAKGRGAGAAVARSAFLGIERSEIPL